MQFGHLVVAFLNIAIAAQTIQHVMRINRHFQPVNNRLKFVQFFHLGFGTGERAFIFRGNGVVKADDIFISMLQEEGLYNQVWQAGVILLPVQSVGVMGDERTYESVVALRAVESTDGMTADWCHLPYEFLARVSNRIINNVRGINRVVYDISSKPPATIEWE